MNLNLAKDIEHLCFDKDGVLIDVHKYWMHTTEIRANFFKNKFGLSQEQTIKLIEKMGIDTSLCKIKHNGPVGYKPREFIINAVKKTLSTFSISTSTELLEEQFLIIDQYQQKKNDFKIEIIDGVEEFLNQYCDKISFTIFTSDRRENAILAMKKFDLLKFFKKILGGDSVKNSKPNPEGILKICNEINISTTKTAYISDTNSDLEMAHKAKLPIRIGVLTGLDKRNELEVYGNVIYDNLNQLTSSQK